MLWQDNQTHWRSISSKIWFAQASPCSSTRYSPTHSTKWSLKVPLISWWSMSGDMISWMSACRTLWVNGWRGQYQSQHPNYWALYTLTKISSSTPYSSHSRFRSRVSINNSVNAHVQWPAWWPSRSCVLAMHLWSVALANIVMHL